MPGFSSNNSGNVVFASNIDFSGSASPANTMLLDGQLLIGSTALNGGGTHCNIGTIKSADGSVTVTNGPGSIDLKVASTPVPVVNNLGVKGVGVALSGGTLTVLGSNGLNFSATNKGTVTLPSPTTAGQQITITLDNSFVNFTVTDSSGTNDLGANTWGVTNANAWASDMPWYIYAIISSAGTDVAFALSRVPNITTAPAAGNMAIAGGAANASTQGSMFLLKKNGITPTAANFASQPCLCVGSLRVQKSGGSGTWVFQTLGIGDGIDRYNENVSFTYAPNQNGATAVTNASSHWVETAGFPAFTSRGYSYTISKNGTVQAQMQYANNTVSGSNANAMNVTFPLKNNASVVSICGYWDPADNSHLIQPFALGVNVGSLTSNGFHLASQTSGTGWNNNNVISGSATAQLSFTYIFVAQTT